MERVLVYGEHSDVFEQQLKKFNIDVVDEDPDVVVAIGGDGTFLESEKFYPGIPKILIKHAYDCNQCDKHDYSKLIKKFLEGKYTIISQLKLEAVVNGNEKKKLVALNDVNIHYTPPRALRVEVSVNNKVVAPLVIGDGVVVATPYGSTGYFNSITKKKFKKGIGLAFNNPTKDIKHLILNDEAVIKVKILRGEGVVVVDCDDDGIDIKEGDEVVVRKSLSEANIVQLKGFNLKITKY